MPLCASSGPVLVRCGQHRTSTGPALAPEGLFMGIVSAKSDYHVICNDPYTPK